jgi:hypothetical protein
LPSRSKRRRKGPLLPVETWTAPRIFSLQSPGARTRLLLALSKLRRIVVRNRRAVVLDFSDTEKLYSDATLLFVAELRHMIYHVRGGVEISCTAPKNDKVAQVLQQLGVFELLGSDCSVQPKDDDVIHWRYAHGRRVEGEKYEDVLADFDGEIAPAMSERLFTGITEAMANVVNHAYEFPREDGIRSSTSDWWMFSQEKDGVLSVVFCDLGAGIPKTLKYKRPNVWKRIVRDRVSGDAGVIGYALIDSVSRTKLTYRGKGLGQIVGLIDAVPGGRVRILSNKGLLKREAGETTTYNYRDSIMGTVINWQIPLPSKEAA